MAAIIVIMGHSSSFLEKYDTDGYSYMIANGLASYFTFPDKEPIKTFYSKTGGYMKGICHPGWNNTNGIKDLNVEWVRIDCSEPLHYKDGSYSEQYYNIKWDLEHYTSQGFKVFLITPYPKNYYYCGIDPRTDEGKEFIKNDIRFLIEEFGDKISALQITNEMGIENFMYPLSIDEAADFIGMQLKEIQDIKGNIVVGFNSTNIFKIITKMENYWKYCDYVGLDIYIGCFDDIVKDIQAYDILIRGANHITGLPVVICEFGYMSYGERKSDAEKIEILKKHGYNSEEEARADIHGFIKTMPINFQNVVSRLDYSSDAELAEKIFGSDVSSLANHVYCELPKGYRLHDYPHTLNGQASFFTDVISRFNKIDCLVGSFVYQYTDSSSCYICGQSDCPVETGWGLVDLHGNPKPSYYAVKQGFAQIDK